MESLPSEMVTHIFSLLPIADKSKLRRVSRSWKLLADEQLAAVKRMRTGPAAKCPFGCRTLDVDVCRQAADPLVLMKILKLCPNMKQLALDGDGIPEDLLDPDVAETLSRMDCFSCENQVIDQIPFAKLRHLRCRSITDSTMQQVMPALQGLAFQWTTFSNWQAAPKGLMFLCIESENAVIPITDFLLSPASATIQRLELYGFYPEVGHQDLAQLPVHLPQLQKLRITDYQTSFTGAQFHLINLMVRNSQVTHLWLEFFPRRYSRLRSLEALVRSYTQVRSLRQFLFTEEVTQLEKLVDSSPHLTKAELFLSHVTPDVLAQATKWSSLKSLYITSFYKADRMRGKCTPEAFISFVSTMTKRQLRNVYFVDNLTFNLSQRTALMQVKKTNHLRLMLFQRSESSELEEMAGTEFFVDDERSIRVGGLMVHKKRTTGHSMHAE